LLPCLNRRLLLCVLSPSSLSLFNVSAARLQTLSSFPLLLCSLLTQSPTLQLYTLLPP
ncbi:hypothetical protein S245_008651, partial [Arachis hypogaea]